MTRTSRRSTSCDKTAKPFALDLGTEAVKPGQTQRLVVMVNKKSAAAGIWRPVELRVK